MSFMSVYMMVRRCGLVATWVVLVGVFFASCDVHEFPQEEVKMHVFLRLRFTTDIPWSVFSSGDMLQGSSYSRGVIQNCTIRSIVRLYNRSGDTRTDVSSDYQEFVYYFSATDSYDNVFAIDVPQGNYQVMVWSDFINGAGGTAFYDAEDFADIQVTFPYVGNSDYRDAFRGYAEIDVTDFEGDGGDEGNRTVTVEMSRPLAKYEFISTDLKEFMAQESRAQARGMGSDIDLNDYRIKFFYEGYVPTSFSMLMDKPVDSATGISFDGSLNVLSDDEVSLGFDYVFVNHKETSISVKIGIFNQKGELISLTNPVDVPLKRSVHTLVRGRFLMEKSSSSVTIDSSYEDDYNIVF